MQLVEFGDLMGGPSGIPPLTAFDKDGLKIIFSFEKQAAQPSMCNVLNFMKKKIGLEKQAAVFDVG